MNLRPYQEKGVADIRAAYLNGYRRPLFCAPTGAGKTVIFAYIAANASAKCRRVIILVHRRELLDQASATLTRAGVKHALIVSGEPSDDSQLVQVASVGTLVRRLDSTEAPALIICDECHHGTSGTHGAILSHWPTAKVLGVSATPARLDGAPLKDVFDFMIRGPEVMQLMDAGYLCRARYFAPPVVADLSGIRKIAGDFNRGEAANAMDKPAIVGDAVAHYRRICNGVPAVAFCVSIKHAEHVAAAFRAEGYASDVIDGTLTKQRRRELVEMLADGRIQVLVSCELISEGFDIPKVTAAILLRPTHSVGLHLQQIGRALRPFEGKEFAFVIDHVGNLLRHGLAEDAREWSLEGKVKRKGPAEVSLSQCKRCFAIYEPVPKCPYCEYIAPVKVRKLEVKTGELVEIEAIAARTEQRKEQGKARSFKELVEIGRQRGFKNPSFWARKVLSGRK